ncbi:MAG: hypothetical protein QXW79_02460, partial [Thermoplasmata archaeon]
RIQALTEKIKEQEEATGRFQRNVGNYKNDILEAFNALGLFNSQITGTINGLSNAISIIRKTEFSLKNLQKALTAVKGGLAIGAIISFFSTTEEGQKKIQKALAFLQAYGFAILKALNEVGKTIVDNVTGFFEAIFDASKLLFSGEFEKAFKRLENFKFKNVDKDIFLNILKDGKELFNILDNINELQSKNKELNREISKTVAQQRVEAEILQQIAEDGTKSFGERRLALARSLELTEQIAKKELQLAKQNLAFEEQRLKLKEEAGLISQEEKDAVAEATKAFFEKQGEFNKIFAENQKIRRELLQDEINVNLDILIDGFDNIKTINEQILANEQKSFEERQKILEETKRLGEETFLKQIEQIQQVAKTQIDANDLLATSDAKILRDKIRNLGLSENLENRLLEIIKERRAAIQDLQVAETELFNNKKQKELDAFNSAIELQQAILEIEEENINRRVEFTKKGFDDLILITEQQFELQKEQLKINYEQQLELAKDNLQERERIENEFKTNLLKLEQQTATKTIEIQKRAFETSNQLFSQTVGAVGNLFGALDEFFKQAEREQKAFAIAQATASYVQELQNIFATNTNPAAGGGANILTFGGAGLGISFAQAAAATLRYITNVAKITQAGAGGTFLTTKPTLILVGDNPSGVEKVTVEPIGAKGVTKVDKNSGLIKLAGGGEVIAQTRSFTNQIEISDKIQKAIKNIPQPVLVVEDFKKVERKISIAEKTSRL